MDLSDRVRRRNLRASTTAITTPNDAKPQQDDTLQARRLRYKTGQQVSKIVVKWCGNCSELPCLAATSCAHADKLKLTHTVCPLGDWGQTFAVLGPFRGGTSCVAGVLHHLGINMGRDPRRMPANPKGFYEDLILANMCRRHFPEPRLIATADPSTRVDAVRRWYQARRRQDGWGSIGTKHPSLCLMLPQLVLGCPTVRLISVVRPVHQVKNSMRRLKWGWSKENITTNTDRLVNERDTFLAKTDRPTYCISYEALMLNPRAELDNLITFLRITPTAKQLADTLNFIDPRLWRHK